MSRSPAVGTSILFRADLLQYLIETADQRGCSLSYLVNEAVLLAKHTAQQVEALDDIESDKEA
jgi:hypothetical protein